MYMDSLTHLLTHLLTYLRCGLVMQRFVARTKWQEPSGKNQKKAGEITSL